MQTITGTLRLAGSNNVLPLTQFQLLERVGTLAGNIVGTVTTDVSGNFSFQLREGTFFLRYGNDTLPFRVKETSGSTTIGTLVEG